MNWQRIEADHIWHPLTQMQDAPLPILIERGKGALLYSKAGEEYIDTVSSWWVNVHGHCHPAITKAISTQAATLDHVIFAGFTHEPALACAERLAMYLDPSLKKMFFSDSGSTAVEVGIKMAYQYWDNLNQPTRRRFLTFEGNYHGDTFGSMSVGKTSIFHHPFGDLLFETHILPWPVTWPTDATQATQEAACLEALEHYLTAHGHETAVALFEPILQGASGMRYCRPEFIAQVVQRCRAYGILILFDEVMTGFGRLGRFFAYELIGQVPDIICLAKGLSGGTLPLAVTVATQAVYEAFLGADIQKALKHSHSFTANALCCAAATASLALFEEENTLACIAQLSAWHATLLSHHLAPEDYQNVRVIGSIAAFEVPWAETAYGTAFSLTVRAACLQHGVILRPIGNTIYLMPPYCITHDQLEKVYATIGKVLRTIQNQPIHRMSGTQ